LAILITFLFVSISFCFLEWFVHRGILHAVISSWMVNLYHRHGRHHGLTIIAAAPAGAIRRKIISKYFIVENKQWESVSFADYTLLAFFAFYTLPLGLLQFVFGHAPFLIAGYSAITVAYVLYEVFHQLEHRPDDWWLARKNNPVSMLFKRPVEFLKHIHEYHHLNPYCNMAIAGFFGIPLADICFKTLYVPPCSLTDKSFVRAEDLRPPEPLGWVSKFDRWAKTREKRLLMELSEKQRNS